LSELIVLETIRCKLGAEGGHSSSLLSFIPELRVGLRRAAGATGSSFRQRATHLQLRGRQQHPRASQQSWCPALACAPKRWSSTPATTCSAASPPTSPRSSSMARKSYVPTRIPHAFRISETVRVFASFCNTLESCRNGETPFFG
jgi:hypothetical protein